MAVFYVSSVNGNDANDGTTKALAKATINGASGIIAGSAFAAGDTLRIDAAHVETFTVDTTIALPGTETNVNILISINWTPDTFLRASAAQLETTAAGNDLFISGSYIAHGIYWKTADRLRHEFASQLVVLNDSTIEASGVIRFATSSGRASARMVDVEVIAHGNTAVIGSADNGHIEWINGPNNRSKYTRDGSQPATSFGVGNRQMHWSVVGVDLTSITTTLFGVSIGAVDVTLKNCSLAAGVSFMSSPTVPRNFGSMVNCDDGTGNKLYRTEILAI